MSVIKVGSLVRFPSEKARDKALDKVGGTHVNRVPLHRFPITAIFKVTAVDGTSCRIDLPNLNRPVDSQGGNWTALQCLEPINHKPIL